jgi:alpha-aminoadipic semialdehyde synthase
MGLLARFLCEEGEDGGEGEGVMLPRLVDFELIVGEDGKRRVGFGWFAGGEYLSIEIM